MSSSLWWKKIEDRLAAIEARLDAEDSLSAYSRTVLAAIEALRKDLEALPQYGMRIPNLAELPIGVEIALRAEGVIENARFEARKGKNGGQNGSK